MKNELPVVAKKSFGQNFLTDVIVIDDIVNAINSTYSDEYRILEIGPGLGALTDNLIKTYDQRLSLVEIDVDLYDILLKKYAQISSNIINEDFLKLNLEATFKEKIMVVGNLPYNISSPIFFKLLKNRDLVKSMVFTIQKEVAERLVAKPNCKAYGIPSILMQCFYDIEYLFSIPPTAFNPIPKVTSAVIKLTRNNVKNLDCDESRFATIVKQAFNQRRKTIRNSLKGLIPENLDPQFLSLRAEQLSIQDFIGLVKS